MPRPFPGMDPYLEPHWLAVYAMLVTDTWRHLNRVLPEGLIACVEERLAIEADDDGRTIGRLGPDVRVLDTDRRPVAVTPIAIDAPYRLEAPDPITTDRHVTVVDADGNLVTTIEFVSPTNMRRPGSARFRQNREALLDAGTHCVEIDLVRRGNWRALMRPERCPPAAISTYRAIVRTAGDDGMSHLFPIHLRDPLPDVPVPLRPGDRPAVLPLRGLMDAIYDDGRWSTRLDYTRRLRPPLEPDDAAWAAELLAGRPSAR